LAPVFALWKKRDSNPRTREGQRLPFFNLLRKYAHSIRFGTGPQCSYHHFISLGGPPGPRSRSMIQLGTDPFCIIFDFLINEKSVQMGFQTLLGVK